MKYFLSKVPCNLNMNSISSPLVTFITNFPMEKPITSNYTEVLIEPVYNYWEAVQEAYKFTSIFEANEASLMVSLDILNIVSEKTTEYALQQPKIKEIFERKNRKNVYDLLIAHQFYQEAFLALGVVYDIPIVTLSTMDYGNFMSQMMGYITPWSFVPHGYLPFGDKMDFWERLQNTFACFYEDLHRELTRFPKHDALIGKYLSHLPVKIPKVSEMEKNISMILLNSHIPLTTPRPTIAGLVEIGGIHINPPKAIRGDLKLFLDDAPHGVIYFSLGSNVDSSRMPPAKVAIFLEAFAGLKQKILWKISNKTIVNLPRNVMIKDWMPQNDILAHPNVKVFISHGGLFGIQEAVYHQVPLLGIPFHSDQSSNLVKATKAGYAITLSFNSITKDSLQQSLMELITNRSYKNCMKQVSQIFRDRPLSSKALAMYWIGYVIRYKGAPHLRSAGRNLAWYQFYLLDVIGVILLVTIVVMSGVFLSIKSLVRYSSKKSKVKTS